MSEDGIGTAQNPYTAPRASLSTEENTDGIVLASRGRRLAAVLLDGLIFVLIFLVVAILVIASVPNGREELARIITAYMEAETDYFQLQLLNPWIYVEIVFYLVAYFIINGYYLATRGQSLGKMILDIRIVDADTHQVVPLTRIIFLRYFIFDTASFINLFLGLIVEIVDMFSIFRRDRRMIHDLVANTVVIKV